MPFRKSYPIMIFLVAVLLSATGYPANSLAGPPDKVNYHDTKKFTPVTFDHKGHIDQGLKCGDCHPKIFKMKIGSADEGNAMTMKTMKKGKFCGACHDGGAAFSVRTSCKKCHLPQ